jgi:hypothetical protein
MEKIRAKKINKIKRILQQSHRHAENIENRASNIPSMGAWCLILQKNSNINGYLFTTAAPNAKWR